MKRLIFVLAVALLGSFTAWTIKSEVANHRRFESEWSAARQLTVTSVDLHPGYSEVCFAGTDTVLITQVRNPNFATIRYLVSPGLQDTTVYIQYFGRDGRLFSQGSGYNGHYLLPRAL